MDDLPQWGELDIEVHDEITTVDVFGIYGPPRNQYYRIQNNYIGPRLIKANFQDRLIRVENASNTPRLRARFVIETPSCWDMITMISVAQGCSVLHIPRHWRPDGLPRCTMIWPPELFTTIFDWKNEITALYPAT